MSTIIIPPGDPITGSAVHINGCVIGHMAGSGRVAGGAQ
jgi:hypothetical protein